MSYIEPSNSYISDRAIGGDSNDRIEKQKQLLYLLNFLDPISEENYPEVIKRIGEMTDVQMQQLYQLIEPKVKDKMAMQKQQEGELGQPRMSTELSSNF